MHIKYNQPHVCVGGQLTVVASFHRNATTPHASGVSQHEVCIYCQQIRYVVTQHLLASCNTRISRIQCRCDINCTATLQDIISYNAFSRCWTPDQIHQNSLLLLILPSVFSDYRPSTLSRTFKMSFYLDYNPELGNNLPCDQFCLPGLCEVAFEKGKYICYVYCPVHRVTMEIERHSTMLMFKIAKKAALNSDNLERWASDCASWPRLPLRHERIAVQHFSFKCPQCTLQYTSSENVLHHQFLFHEKEHL